MGGTQGVPTLYSAADMESHGAIDAHYRWGFEFIDRADWFRAGLKGYLSEVTVAFARLSVMKSGPGHLVNGKRSDENDSVSDPATPSPNSKRRKTGACA